MSHGTSPRRLTWGIGRLLAVLAFTVASSGTGLYLVHSNYQVVRAGYLLDQELFQYRRELEIKRRLQLELALRKDPQTVPERVQSELGMRRPGPADELLVPTPEGNELSNAGPRAPSRGLP